jgi:predicted nucleic acid-binding Zn ribbon protein
VSEDEPDPLAAAREALARARRVARERGLRTGRPGTQGRRSRGPRGGTSPEGSARDPQTVTDEVDRLLASRGWDADVQVGAVVGRWPAIVGDTVAGHVAPVAFEERTLTVQADSTAWATQMRLLVNTVLARIENEVGPDVVSEIVVKGPGGPTWRKGPLRTPGPGPRDTYG